MREVRSAGARRSAVDVPAGVLIGYLAGSVSFTRVFARLAPRRPDVPAATAIDTVVMSRFSPSALGIRSGHAWGIVAALLEIAKGWVAVRSAHALFPRSAAAEAALAGAVAGHVYPVFHRFRGGYGQSPMVGGMVALDPRAILVAATGSTIAGIAVADEWVVQDGWPLGLVAWAAWKRDRPLLAATIAANAIYLRASWPDMSRHLEQRRARSDSWWERVRSMPAAFGQGVTVEGEP